MLRQTRRRHDRPCHVKGHDPAKMEIKECCNDKCRYKSGCSTLAEPRFAPDLHMNGRDTTISRVYASFNIKRNKKKDALNKSFG